MNELPISVGRLVCANGQTIEWTLRVGGRVIARCWRDDNALEAMRTLLDAVVNAREVP